MRRLLTVRFALRRKLALAFGNPFGGSQAGRRYVKLQSRSDASLRRQNPNLGNSNAPPGSQNHFQFRCLAL